MKDFSYLHISDLHVGMKDSGWLWPSLKASFYEDISYLFDKTKGWNAVIFSGDVAQSGGKDEYDRAADILAELWALFRKLGCSPVLIHAPGNHDLVWPDSQKPALLLMKDWWLKQAVREATLNDENSLYRELLVESFANFEAWRVTLAAAGINLPEIKKGLFPATSLA